MSIMSVIKENRVFVAGILLPFLLIALLAVAKNIPPIDPPHQQVVFWTKGWSDRGALNALVKDDSHVEFTYTKTKNALVQPNYAPPPVTATLYIYNPVTNTTREIPIKLTDDDMKEDSKVISVPEIANITLSKTSPSQDGYNFESYSYNRNSMITEIFSNNNSYGPCLTKQGRIVRIPPPNGYYNGSPEFLGWVISGDVK